MKNNERLDRPINRGLNLIEIPLTNAFAVSTFTTTIFQRSQHDASILFLFLLSFSFGLTKRRLIRSISFKRILDPHYVREIFALAIMDENDFGNF